VGYSLFIARPLSFPLICPQTDFGLGGPHLHSQLSAIRDGVQNPPETRMVAQIGTQGIRGESFGALVAVAHCSLQPFERRVQGIGKLNGQVQNFIRV
jgi:hypothetical protein